MMSFKGRKARAKVGVLDGWGGGEKTKMASRTTLRDLKVALEEVEHDRLAVVDRLAQLDELANHLRGSIAHFAAMADEQESQPPAKTIRNGMFVILKEVGIPLHYSELLRRLEERGVAVNGKDPLRLVGAHLSNDERFKGIGGGIWGLHSWPDSAFRSNEPHTTGNPGDRSASRFSATTATIAPISLRDRVRGARPLVEPNRRLGSPPSEHDPEAGFSDAGSSSQLPEDVFRDMRKATGSDYDDAPF